MIGKVSDAREVTPKEEAKILLFMSAGYFKMHHPTETAIVDRIKATAKISKALAVIYSNKYF